ncbi:MAG: cation:proton antiporter [Euryarchaeota archaeon]|nr:cation:proton antiporter [Euryarchaeota archaeon]MBV1728734.1 cation:proton antiporter [Methanobacterium sp.]MBU4547398.1 cation:proton antiporter [Euryarchaeota archaeon]MBU4607044.1 cation:proton antiporter [Euryarchaeota archaeon]MBV1754516.1 cation:proton antiporter [Methanobacterium sp.]
MEVLALTLALIILLGLIASQFFSKIGFPGLFGLLLLGIMIGPSGLNLISGSFLNLSEDIRVIALIIILLRAGLGLHREAIRKVGSHALKMSFIPCVIEGVAIIFISQQLLGLSFLEAGMLGFILAASSPAIIVTHMLSFITQKKGTAKGIPTLILAGSSVDDVVSITLFSVFLGAYTGANIDLTYQILGIPLSLILGAAGGFIIGIGLLKLFHYWKINATEKIFLILAAAILFKSLGDLLKGTVPVAGLLGVMIIGFVLVDREPNLGYKLSQKFARIWLLAEIILFVLVGAQVDLSLSLQAGWLGLIIIIGGLLARSCGVYLSLLGSKLNLKEKVFCMVSYTPKATVQAAIGPLPLAAGVLSGELILAISVLAILITAPLGAAAIKFTGERFLSSD